MITQLSTLKARLGIAEADLQYDTILLAAIEGLTARFDKELNRRLARAVDAAQEFPADQTEICLERYPLETITRFELKSSEAEGWVEPPMVDYLVRSRCVLSLAQPLGTQQQLARVIYTGGWVMPGDAGPAGMNLPADLEQAAVEQLAFWFQSRDKLGLTRIWEYHSTYRQFSAMDLLESVQNVLAKHRRMKL